MKRLVLAIAAAAVVIGSTIEPAAAGSHLGGVRTRVTYSSNTGTQWGTYADAQITKALASDPGNNRAYADASLAYAVSIRSPLGWDDPAAEHYLKAALDQPNPWGLNYAWDAFGDHTVNPASTTYSITLVQVGEVVLDAYRHGHAAYTDVTDIERRIVNLPRIPSIKGGLMVAYSNSPNDAKPGYGVHNVNQAIGMFLWEIQHAGILWSDSQVKGWIAAIYVTERAAYQPKVFGWAYRTGGSQAVQDPGHNGVGALWGMIFNPSSVGYPVTHNLMETDYGWAKSAALHATLAAQDCSESRQWFPEWDQQAASSAVVISTFDDAGRFARPLAYSGVKCAGDVAAIRRSTHPFRVLPVKPGLSGSVRHQAPDAVS